jgi:hypothetical protein
MEYGIIQDAPLLKSKDPKIKCVTPTEVEYFSASEMMRDAPHKKLTTTWKNVGRDSILTSVSLHPRQFHLCPVC